MHFLGTVGQEVLDPYYEYGAGTKRQESFDKKSDQLFVWEIQEIDLGFVWDVQRGGPTKEVPGERSDHTRSVRTSRARDISLMSISPKSRRSMFGKADPGPTAAL